MSGTNYLLDSNFIISFSKNNLAALELLKKLPENVQVSIITYMEVLGFDFKNQLELEMIESLFDNMDIVYLSENIVDKVIEIKRKIKIKLPDAIIAATALEHNSILITANIEDFKRVPDLLIRNY
jgi:hypothetical protein